MKMLNKTLTFDELIEIFDKRVVLEMCEKKEEELSLELNQTKREEDNLLRKFAWCDSKDDWLLDICFEFVDERKKKIKNKLRPWQYKKRLLRGEKMPEGHYNLEDLKQIPIKNILSALGYKDYPGGNKRIFYKLRQEEKHASACVYEETNTFYDFGAGVGGDNIALLQWITKYNFKEACDFLKKLH